MRKLLTRLVLAVAALATVLGCLVSVSAPASASAASGCRLSYQTYSTVKVGRTGSKAGAIECLLHRAGYRTTRNRSFSAADAELLAAFQRKHALPATGRADHATWAALIAQGTRPSLKVGARGADVRRLQLALRALGHGELTGTSYYGARTTAAVESLQRSVGQRATGKTTPATWTALQAGGRRIASSVTTTPVSTTAPVSSRGAKALAFAKAQLGEKYRYGAAGPSSWDCSGLTMKAWSAAGVRLPHQAKAQYKIGTKVAKADLRPGDLVFFYSGPSHVAIYAGGGEVIHAPRPGKKVSYISISSMPFKGARRPA